MTGATTPYDGALPLERDDPPQEVPDILGQLLREQAAPSAVEIFAEWHESTEHRQAPMYSALLPAKPPGDGEQYAFEVDMDACTACKACVTACHSLNGLDENETWRWVGLLHGGTDEAPYRQSVTTACHHCVEPACMSGCPVDAYRKDPVTGIVQHLDDQCIGCRYCILTCPYEVPKFNSRRGIVRKCDMCTGRLEQGQAPACVQGCPNDAIRITVANRASIIQEAATDGFMPGAPPPTLSLPTTRYITNRVMPKNTRAVDFSTIRPQEGHPSLVLMLVLTQMSVGAFIAHAWLTSPLYDASTPAVALAFALIALLGSVAHLGRPQLAFRAIIGLRHSWLSREILAFGVFFGVAASYAGLVAVHPDPALLDVARIGVTTLGTAAVLTSAMIYVRTGRPGWATLQTPVRFLLTTAWLGGLSYVAVQAALGTPPSSALAVAKVVMAAAILKLGLEASVLFALASPVERPRRHLALLLTGPLRSLWGARLAFGIVGGAIVVGAFVATGNAGFVWAAWGLSLVGELIGRHLFFVASVAPRMPGELQ